MDMRFVCCLALLPFLLLCISAQNTPSATNCDKKTKTSSYLDIATEMIKNAKETCLTCSNSEHKAMDCEELLSFGHNSSKIYTVWPKNWQSYKNGFGNVDKDFWLGNDNIFALSNQQLYSLRVDLKDVEGNKRYAVYDRFWIDDEDHKYTLHIKGYRGDAGDSLKVPITTKNLQPKIKIMTMSRHKAVLKFTRVAGGTVHAMPLT
ncbi:techylectin-5A [Caerostris extrusa]|uniref:Techylectin-5A n=1 Tax=Caerostris extrusa TaxID=172846 RepID=A0AAV4T765_CAEEX|nr:techylectin-5A [Caerostris extrusa]